MYTLRTIHKGGLEVNTNLGEQYFIAEWFRGGGHDFEVMRKQYGGEAEDADVIAMIRDEKGNLNCLYKDRDNYIMTESGSTFSRINRAEI